MIKRKLASLASLLLCGCTVLSACGNSASATKGDTGSVAGSNVTITYCNFNASGGHEETLEKMYKAFHEENPNITVNIETIAYDDYFTQMQTRVAGGTAPDCYELTLRTSLSMQIRTSLQRLQVWI